MTYRDEGVQIGRRGGQGGGGALSAGSMEAELPWREAPV